MSDSTVTLTLQTAGFDAMRGIASDAQNAAETYQVLAKAGEGFEVEERRVASAMDLAVRSAVEQTQAQRALNAALEDSAQGTQKTVVALKDVAEAGKGAAKAKNQLGAAVQSTAFAVQDFTSQLGTRGLAGALGAVQNNIPNLVTQLGGTAGLAGVVGIVAVGAGLLYENWGKVSALWSGAETAKLPVLAQGLDGIAASLKGITKEIESLEEKSLSDVLSHPEVERLGKLRGLRDEGNRNAADLRAVEGIGENDSKRAREIGAAVKAAIAEAGGGSAVAQNLKANIGGTYQEAVGVVAGAIRGNESDLATLKKNAPTFGREFRAVDPAVIRANKIAEAVTKEEHESAAARIKKNDDLVDALNAEGAKNHDAYLDDVDRDKGKDARAAAKTKAEAERAKAKADRESTPGGQLKAFHDQAYQNAAGVAMYENDGTFNPSQIDDIARQAASLTNGLDYGSIRMAVERAAFLTRQKMQAEFDRGMGRMNVNNDSFMD